MHIDKTLNVINLTTSKDIWVDGNSFKCKYFKEKRIGIDCTTEPYKSIACDL